MRNMNESGKKTSITIPVRDKERVQIAKSLFKPAFRNQSGQRKTREIIGIQDEESFVSD